MPRTQSRRANASTVLSILAVVLAVVALVISYMGRAVLRAEPFADRTVAALSDPAVRDDVADHVTDALVRSHGDLVAVQPLIRTVVGAIVQNGAFKALFRRALVEAHTTVVERGGGTAFVNVADAGVLVGGVLQRFAPQAAETLDLERIAELLTLQPQGAVRDAINIAKALYAAVWALVGAALALSAGALWASIDRGRTVRRLGLGLVVGGLLIAALYLIGGAVAQGVAPAGRGPAAGALWRAFLDGLQVEALVLAAAGAILAAAAVVWKRSAQAGGRPVGTRQRLRAIVAPLRGDLGRSVAALLAGAVIVLEPMTALRIALLAAGLGLLYAGGAGLLAKLAGRPLSRARTGWKSHPVRARLSALRSWTPAALAATALALAGVVIATGGGDEAPPAATPPTCNGYVALCDRNLDDVVFPATHNSMASVTISSWLFGQQDGTIKEQLEYGIRGLLIDTYYGEPAGNRVKTDLQSLPQRAVAERELGAEAVRAAESIRSRIGKAPTGGRRIYLCHGFCELGAVTLASALTDLRAFLIAHPGDLVIIVNQDEGVPPKAIEQALTQAGLLDLIYRGSLGPFPTMREMIDSGQRLVVMAENDAGNISWYHLAFRNALQETPFSFKAAGALTDAAKLPQSCRPNRGPNSAPLFLLNHWVDTTPVPRKSQAKVVNDYAALLRRAQTCEQIRHHLPNLVAVDFYRQGDVVGVARKLNGVGS